MPEFDVAVIGSGTAAQNVVPRCAEAGLRVAVVDRLPYGGTCGRRGCDPKKVLLAAAEAVGRARMLDGRGLTGGPAIDWPALMKRKRGFTEPVAGRIEDWLRSTGAETMHGSARLLGAGRVEVDGRAFDAADIVVATGARPMPLGIKGEELVTISDDVPGAGRPAAAGRLHRRRLHLVRVRLARAHGRRRRDDPASRRPRAQGLRRGAGGAR